MENVSSPARVAKPRGDRRGKPNPGKGPTPTNKGRKLGVTPEDYDRLVQAYRSMGRDMRHSGAAEIMGPGWTEHRCRKLWVSGVPRFGFAPVRDVVSDAHARMSEHQLAVVAAEERERAAVREMVAQEEVRRAAAADAAAVRAEEARMVRAVRGSVVTLAEATQGLMRGLAELSAKVEAKISEMAATGDVDAKAGVALVRQAATIAKFGSEAAANTLKMERALLGDPAALEDETKRGGRLSPEEASRWISVAARALRRAHGAGVVDVVDMQTTSRATLPPPPG